LPLLESTDLTTLAIGFFSVLAWALLFSALALPDLAPNRVVSVGVDIDMDMDASMSTMGASVASVVAMGASVVAMGASVVAMGASVVAMGASVVAMGATVVTTVAAGQNVAEAPVYSPC
jgi:hypothetical protein